MTDSTAQNAVVWIKRPVQERSRRTLDRLLDAAEALLAERTFDEITIADVLSRAKTSVGACYARFHNKEALLDAIYDRHQREAVATIEQATDPNRWSGVGVAGMVDHLVRFIVDLYSTKRGLMRALVLRGHTKADPRYLDRDFLDQTAIRRVGALIGSRADDISHPHPVRAAEVGFLAVLAAAREKLLFGDSTAAALEIELNDFANELRQMFCAYLGVVSSS